ncbi:MAG TPA: DNA polymerase III subunit alpha, partial [Gemmatimonadaceae bacterium]|nr:DNA polymerase III subunit alpha [Gemmatimonadaceae bacterium]
NYSLTVREAIEQIGDVRKLYRSDERYRQLLDFAIALEGLSRHTGVHAAGVVIAPGPVDDYVPVCTQATKGAAAAGEDETVVVSQYDMNGLEKAGMLKIDFLGLTTLTIIHDAVASVVARTGTAPGIDRPPDDEATYRMLRSGRTAGVFQFESPLATDLLRQIRCDRFDDLVASNALMRPGPLDSGMHLVYIRRKRGEERVSYALPELEPILSATYGVITYQEQVMRIAQVLGGVSLGEADVLRKAVGKKDAALIKQELGKFIEKSVARGFDRRTIEDLAGQIETFGRYGFNKSHAVAYSVLSYQTAYLKVHHPADFMAALLSSCIGDTDGVVKYINEARELGLEILPPDVNECGYKFTVIGDRKVRFGLGAIRNVGKSAIDSILLARRQGPFTSLFDLCERVDLRLCNSRVFEALIASGALDGLGGHRSQFAAALESALHEASLTQQERAVGQGSLFGTEGTGGTNGASATPRALPNIAPAPETERLAKEKEILGFYISGHPLEPFRMEAELFATHTVSQLGGWSEDQIALAVVITSVKRQLSKRSGAEFARLTVEDFSGSSEVLVFPEAWTLLGSRASTDLPVLLKGGYSRRDQDVENPTFIVESITPIAELRLTGQVAIALDFGHGSALTPDVVRDVRVVLESHATTHAGAPPVEVVWGDAGARARPGEGSEPDMRFRSRRYRLAASQAVLTDLRALLGPERVRLVRVAAAGGGGR